MTNLLYIKSEGWIHFNLLSFREDTKSKETLEQNKKGEHICDEFIVETGETSFDCVALLSSSTPLLTFLKEGGIIFFFFSAM